MVMLEERKVCQKYCRADVDGVIKAWRLPWFEPFELDSWGIVGDGVGDGTVVASFGRPSVAF